MSVIGLLFVLGIAWYAFPIVPNVAGSSAEDARQVIVSRGLSLDEFGYARMPLGNSKSGVVASQTPGPGMPGWRWSRVHLVLTGYEPIPVPDLLGETDNRVKQKLASAGLVAGARTQKSKAGYPPGWVLDSDPPPGTLVQPGTAVDLVVVQDADIIVPSTLGMKRVEAVNALKGRGLVVAVDSSTGSGIVVAQLPMGGSAVRPGRKVTIVVSSHPKPTTEPEVTRRGDHFFVVASGIAQAKQIPASVASKLTLSLWVDDAFFFIEGVPRSVRDGDILELEMGQSVPEGHEAAYVARWP